MRERSGKGFTLVELVIVIAIVGILAAIAIPRFIDIRTEAHTAQRDSVVGSVRAGILTVASKNQAAGGSGTFPPNLEADWNGIGSGGVQPGSFPSTCAVATPCFELVIPGGVTISAWSQTAAGTYVYTHPISSTTYTCTYSSTNGTLTCS